MAKTTYTTRIFSETMSVTADWAQASSPVSGVDGGYQVADFRHSPKLAMRRACEQLVRDSGDQPDDFADEIDAAVDSMKSE